MKKFAKYMFLAFAGCLSLASCSDDDDWSPGQADAADVAGVYFPTTTQEIEVDPEDATQFNLTVSRLNTSGALSVPVVVVQNDSNVFNIPSTIEFADGQASTTITVNYPNAEEGTAYSFVVGIPDEYINHYKEIDGGITSKFTVTRVKWEDAGEGYWIDGAVCQFWGVNQYPCVVNYQVNKTATGVRFRFNSPYAYPYSAGSNDYGYYGYPYNDDGDCDGLEHKMVITVTSSGASLAPFETGMNWGYGMISIGSIYGYLSTNIESYPLGVYNESQGYIAFPANSLYISMTEYNNGGRYPASAAGSYFFLNAEALVNIWYGE